MQTKPRLRFSPAFMERVAKRAAGNVIACNHADLPANPPFGALYDLLDQDKRTVCYNGAEYVDVYGGEFYAYDFGCPRDGVSDCGPALNKLETIVANNGAGTIKFGPLNHIINTQVVRSNSGSNIGWEGVGKGLTNFVFTFNGGTSTAPGILIQGNLNGPPISGNFFKRMSFSGLANNDTQGAFAGIYVGYNVFDFQAEDCEFFWFKNVGLHISAVSSTGQPAYGSNFTATRCHFHDNGTNQMYQWLSGGAFTGIGADLKLIDCLFENNGHLPQAATTSGGQSIYTVNNVAVSSNVATVTTSVAHGFSAGNLVTLTGLANTAFVGTFTLTNVTSTTFSFALTHADMSATDNGSCWQPSVATINNIMVSHVTSPSVLPGQSATITTVNPHNFSVGNVVVLEGLTNTFLNGSFSITSVSTNTFTFTVNYANVSSVADSGTCYVPGNNWHGAYLNAQAGVQVRGSTFNGICSRLHLFGAGLTEPPVDFVPPLIVGNTFNGQYGGQNPNVSWSAVGSVWAGNTFYNTGLSVGSNTQETATINNVQLTNNTATLTGAAASSWGAGMRVKVSGLTNTQFNGTWLIDALSGVSGGQATGFSYALFQPNVASTSDSGTAATFVESGTLVVGNTWIFDQNVPANPIYAIQDGAIAPNVVFRNNRIVSKITTANSLIYVAKVAQTGSSGWTIEHNTVFGDISQGYQIGLALLTNTNFHKVRGNRIDSTLNSSIILLNSCRNCDIYDNDMNLGTTGAVQPIWELEPSPTNRAFNNCIVSNSLFTGIGPTIRNFDNTETAPVVPTANKPRIAGRQYRTLMGAQYWAPGAIAPGTAATATVSVPGAMPGDFATASMAYDPTKLLQMNANVTSPDSVNVWLYNPTASTQTLSSTATLHAGVRQTWPDWGDGAAPGGTGTATVTLGSLTSTGVGTTATATVAIVPPGTANIGDAVYPSLTAIGTGIIVALDGWVSSDGTCTVRGTNLSGTSLTLGAGVLTVQTRSS